MTTGWIFEIGLYENSVNPFGYSNIQCYLIDFFWGGGGFRLLEDPSELQRLGKSTPTTEDTCSRRPGVKEVFKSVLVDCCTQ